jgi:hypothetical protein
MQHKQTCTAQLRIFMLQRYYVIMNIYSNLRPQLLRFWLYFNGLHAHIGREKAYTGLL